MAVTEIQSERASPSLSQRVQNPAVILMLMFWSAVVGDLLCWADLYPSDLILHPFHSLRAIGRGIVGDAGTMLLYLFYGSALVVPAWLFWSFVGRRGVRQCP